ncbi:hypothetical protein IJV57_00795 [Candidatus Saccharibacteria bacterium]|nr:hypothetical protein [Candidatus Saccharibacteria bacterium]
MTKKKVLAIAGILGISALVLSAGTLAYFTDTETETNTFTLGKVDIELKEYDHQGNVFVQNQKIMPGSSSTAVQKNAIVTVKDDSEESWVWVEMLIPSALYNSKTETQESNNALHYNQLKTFLDGYSTNSGITTVYDDHDTHQWSLMTYVDEVTVNGKEYSRLRSTHKDKVAAGYTTSPAISQVYVDDDVKTVDGKVFIPTGQQTTNNKYSGEFAEYAGDWEVIINAYAVQAEGIANVNDAVAAYAAQNS